MISLIVLGLFLLKKGADWFVRGSSELARRFRIPELAIGLTIVAFGTSAPELVVNVVAASQGSADILFGNVIGSNNFNLFVILSLVGLIAPVTLNSSTAWREIPFSTGAILLLFLLANDTWLFGRPGSELTRLDGLVMLLFFTLFLWYVFRQMKKDPQAETGQASRMRISGILGLMVLGLGGLVVGGKLVVESSVRLATQLGVSEKVIGLTIVAAGTSLPELATSVVAARRKNMDIAVGNIIGSNIFNILFILPVSSMIRPPAYHPAFNMDLGLLALGTLLLLASMYTGHRMRIDRWEAIVLFAVYIYYLTRMLGGFPVR